MEKQVDIIFFDLETTGLDLANDRIIEISAIKTDHDLNEKSRFDLLINPDGREIAPDAFAKHGKTIEDLKDKKTFGEIAERLFKFFDGCALAGFNILNFDVPFLIEEFKRFGLEFDPIKNETQIIDAYRILARKEKRDLQNTYRFYTGKDREDWHQATADNEATIEIFREQARRYEFKETLNDADKLTRQDDNGNEMIDFSGMFLKTPDEKFIFGKGKHKDKFIDDSKDTIDYMGWIIDKSDFNNNTKYVAKKLRDWSIKKMKLKANKAVENHG